MRRELKYIELKTGYADDGPAWIGYVEFSRSGQTVYFNNMAIKSNGHGGGLNIENGDLYWITGVKKTGSNRHVFGKGKIQIDKDSLKEYLELTGQQQIDLSKFEVIEVSVTDKTRFDEIQNNKI